MNLSRLSLARPRLSPALALRARLCRPFLPVVGGLPLLALPLCARPAHASGVQAWTSGSQTYLRARPSQKTPIVAKVPKHTPLFVWGKYNGWYRVETHDHIYGWVHYELINSPALSQVKELPHSVARRASDRNGNQTMYGKPDQLASYFKKHGAPGAVAGLREMGVKVTFGPKAHAKKTVAKPAAKPRPKPVVAKPANRPAPKAKVSAVSVPKIAAKPVAVKPVAVKKAAAPKAAIRPSAPKTIRAAAPRVLMPNNAAQSAQSAPKPVVRAVTAPVAATAPATVTTPVKLLPAPPQRVAVPARKAAPTRKVSKAQSARDRKRQRLRAKMGMTDTTPPLPIGDIAPVSPEELMKARRAYLEERKKKFGSDSSNANASSPASPDSMGGPKVTPSNFEFGGASDLDAQGWAPFNTNGWSAHNGGPSFADWNTSRTTGFRLVIEEEDSEMDNGELGDWANLPALDSLKIQTRGNAQKKPALAAPSRGGSPRDRYKNPNGDFRQQMANQALSYRGRPYIRGAASPSRGFDCSGLIYYLLRQRGYNPPRTAAGFSRYGTAVARGQWKPGDLLLFANTYKRGISHIGIYLGNNKFVHAASSRQGVRVDSMNTKYYAAKYHSARRVPVKN